MTDTSFTSENATTLAIWCARSGSSYNTGVLQTVIALAPKEFRTDVAKRIVSNPESTPESVAVWERFA